MKSIRKILASMRNADQKFNLIIPNDRIAVGISGGKDSLTLFYALTLYKRFSKKNFEIVPILLDLGFSNIDFTPLKNWFKSLGYTLCIEDNHNVAKILEYHKKDKLPCSICSRMKKAAINLSAHQHGCNKVAFAHHADDAIETLWMNEVFGARIATFSPKMHLEKTDLVFIRPLILARESVIRTCAEEMHFPITSLGCPNDKHTSREDAKEWLSLLYKKYPSAKENFLTMLYNYEKEDLWKDHLFYALEGTNLSIRPVIAIDTFYKMLQLIQSYKNTMDLQVSYQDYTSFLLYEDQTAIGYIMYQKDAERHFILKDIAVPFHTKQKEYEILLLKWLENKLFLEANPCELEVDANISSLSIFDTYSLKENGTRYLSLTIEKK